MGSAKMGSLLLKRHREFGLDPEENMTIINDLEKEKMHNQIYSLNWQMLSNWVANILGADFKCV